MRKMISRGELFIKSDKRLVVRTAENFKFKRKFLAKIRDEKESDITRNIYNENQDNKNFDDINFDDKNLNNNNYKDENCYKNKSDNYYMRKRKFEAERNREINAENDRAGEKGKNWLSVGNTLLLLIGVEDEEGGSVEDLVIVPAVIEAGPRAAGEEMHIPGEKDCENDWEDERDKRYERDKRGEGDERGGVGERDEGDEGVERYEGERNRKWRPRLEGEEIVVRLKVSLEELVPGKPEMNLGKPEMKNLKSDQFDLRHSGLKEANRGNSDFNKTGFEEPAGKNKEKKGLKEQGLRLIDAFAEGDGAYYSVFALKEDRIYEIYSDGACRGNPGPGGYAAVVLENGEMLEEISGNREETTNNRMELLAVIEGLKSLAAGSRVRIYTDSNYVLRGMEEWLDNWMNNGWVTSGGKPVKNQDLWKRIAELQEKYRIELIKVKGHSGDKFNNRADQLAKKACQKAREEDF